MKTITVKGIGAASAKPNLIVISLLLESVDLNYEKSVSISADKINNLNKSLENIGFEKSSIKTTNFNVDMRYDSVKDENGSYIRKFKGYACTHRLKIEFNFDTKKLSKTLQAIACCMAEPELNISFTIKDPTAINEELLKSASQNAKSKAEILCKSSGVTLGNLVSIDYNFGEHNIISPTRYALANECVGAPLMKARMASVDFEPENIDVKDTVTFVWEII